MKKFIVILLIVVILFRFGIQSSSGLFYVNNANAKINSPAPIWPMFHYNAKRTGRCPYDTSKLQATLKWKYGTGNRIYSSPAIGSDGTVYVGSYDHYLYAINPNGTLKWKYGTGGSILSSPAIGSDGTVYVGSGDNYLYAIGCPNLPAPQHFKVSSSGTTSTLTWDYPSFNEGGTLWFNYYEYNPNTQVWDYKGHTAYPTKKIVITNQSYGKHQYRMRVKYPKILFLITMGGLESQC